MNRGSGWWWRWTCWCRWRSTRWRWRTCRTRVAQGGGCRCSGQWTGVGSFGVAESVASAAARFRPEDCFEQPRRGRRASDAPRDTGNTKERAKTTLLVSYWLWTRRRPSLHTGTRRYRGVGYGNGMQSRTPDPRVLSPSSLRNSARSSKSVGC